MKGFPLTVPAPVVCPYCGHSFKLILKTHEDVRPHVVLCNTDNGGCDMEFVLFAVITTKVVTSKITWGAK